MNISFSRTYAQASKNFSPIEVVKLSGTDVSFNMILVHGNTFSIGSLMEQYGESDERPIKHIKLSDFYIGETEVTYDVFQLYLDESKDPNPKSDAISRPSPPYIDFTLGMGKVGGYPANSMQQYTALMFCKWLFQKTGIFYRLPTEAEWEYVAKLSYPNFDFKDSTSIMKYEWFAQNSDEKYHIVASKEKSALGLYDLLGNVSEWTLDQYDAEYYSKINETTLNPLCEKTKRFPITVRGGNYKSNYLDLRPSNRTKSDPVWNRRDPQIPKSKWWNADAPFIGFRIVRPIPQPSKKEIETFFLHHLK